MYLFDIKWPLFCLDNVMKVFVRKNNNFIPKLNEGFGTYISYIHAKVP